MKWAIVIAVLAVVGLAEAASAEVEATLLRVEESRSTTFVKDDFGRPKDSLTVQLALKGPEAQTAFRYGDVKFDEAVDDQGTSLIPAADSMSPASEFTELQNNFFRPTDAQRKEHPDGWAYLSLAPAKRSARAIKHLRGGLSVATRGTVKRVEATGLLTAGKQTMDIPAAAGIQIALTVIHPAGKETPSIDVAISGDPNALESFEVVNANGQTINEGIWTVSYNRRAKRQQFDLKVPLEDSMKVVAKVAVDRKITRVRFDLGDIPLP